MKITANQIMTVTPILSKLGNAELSLKLAISIASLIKAIEEPYKITVDRRDKLTYDYAEKDEGGNPIFIDNNRVNITNMSEFVPKMEELLSTEVEINCLPLDLETLQNEDIKISAKEYLVLQDIFSGDKIETIEQ